MLRIRGTPRLVYPNERQVDIRSTQHHQYTSVYISVQEITWFMHVELSINLFDNIQEEYASGMNNVASRRPTIFYIINLGWVQVHNGARPIPKPCPRCSQTLAELRHARLPAQPFQPYMITLHRICGLLN